MLLATRQHDLARLLLLTFDADLDLVRPGIDGEFLASERLRHDFAVELHLDLHYVAAAAAHRDDHGGHHLADFVEPARTVTLDERRASAVRTAQEALPRI